MIDRQEDPITNVEQEEYAPDEAESAESDAPEQTATDEAGLKDIGPDGGPETDGAVEGADPDTVAPLPEAATSNDAGFTAERTEDSPSDEATCRENMRLLEAFLFASSEPVEPDSLKSRLPDGADLEGLLSELSAEYTERGVNLVRIGGKWAFRTAPDLAGRLMIEAKVRRKLSRAAVETLAVIAYHQPVTRAEIEEIRGVGQSRGTLDVLLEAGWIRPGRRRRTPGRPVTWQTTETFLDHFGLAGLEELPGVDELKAAGLLDTRSAVGIFRERGDLGPVPEAEEAEADADVDAFDASDLQSNLLPLEKK